MIARYSGKVAYFLPTDETLIVTYKAYDDPGRLYGPPENCYPPESEMEILSITNNGKEYEPSASTLELIEEACWEDFWQAINEREA